VGAAVTAWRSMRTRDDVAALLASGSRLHEVPFSLCTAGSSTFPAGSVGPLILRGTIDCLIQRDDGSIVVVEFKSGSPQGFHQKQIDLYVEAARALFPQAAVEGRLIYPIVLPGSPSRLCP
jgi:ATP-dependent exoDNAse (exonuclease V) beta subunit